MEKRTSFRTRVMKYAWQLWRTTNQAWSTCMTKAWELYRLAKLMREGIVTFLYRKADGSIRKAKGTLRDLPAGTSVSAKKPTYKTFAYFDTEKQSFRCFRIENLVCAPV